MADAIFESHLHSLPLIARGKVRDNYAVGSDRILMVASDRISAFDVVMGEPIPGKGEMLTRMALFWFHKLAHVVPNHLTGKAPESVVAPDEVAQVRGRSMLVKRLKPLPIEAVVRGYLIGSGWKDYQQTGAVCGIKLPAGLQLAAKLPEAIFTPATKAEEGHDENISFEQAQIDCGAALAEILKGTGKNGAQIATEARNAAIALYTQAADFALTRGIIIADTKFEFGVDATGTLHLIDEALTPDSSRFWPADSYQLGTNPPSYDKQYVRDHLETLDWPKTYPGPTLPAEVIARTSAKYVEAYEQLTGKKLVD